MFIAGGVTDILLAVTDSLSLIRGLGYFVSYIFIMKIVFFNVIVGVVCQLSNGLAFIEKEDDDRALTVIDFWDALQRSLAELGGAPPSDFDQYFEVAYPLRSHRKNAMEDWRITIKVKPTGAKRD